MHFIICTSLLLKLGNTHKKLQITIRTIWYYNNCKTGEVPKWRDYLSVICAWILVELDRFWSRRVYGQRTSDFLMMFCPHKFTYYICSGTDLKLQCKRNFNTTSLGNCDGGSSSIKWSLITYYIHWYNTVTFSWLIMFLQLQKDTHEDVTCIACQNVHVNVVVTWWKEGILISYLTSPAATLISENTRLIGEECTWMPKNVAGLYMVMCNVLFTVKNFVGTPVKSEPSPTYRLCTAKLCNNHNSVRTISFVKVAYSYKWPTN